MFAKLREWPAFLYVQRFKGFDPPSDEPWMDPAGAARFKCELSRATGYIEYGSGGTTVLADRLRIPAVSVESDPYYARAVATRLTGSIQQVVVPVGVTGPWGTPLISTFRKAQRYVNAPFDRGFFPDFILVDGRYRAACALNAARQAAQRNRVLTLMFDDYKNRPWYHFVEEHIGRPEIVGRAAIFALERCTVDVEVVRSAMADKR